MIPTQKRKNPKCQMSNKNNTICSQPFYFVHVCNFCFGFRDYPFVLPLVSPKAMTRMVRSLENGGGWRATWSSLKNIKQMKGIPNSTTPNVHRGSSQTMLSRGLPPMVLWGLLGSPQNLRRYFVVVELHSSRTVAFVWGFFWDTPPRNLTRFIFFPIGSFQVLNMTSFF